VAIFGKSWDFHVTDILKTTLDENLRMIFDTISFFKNKNKEVVLMLSISLTDTRPTRIMQ